MAANSDLENNVEEVEEEEEEEERPRRRNPLRVILLILLVLVGLCAVCFLGSNFMGTNILSSLPIPIPGRGPGQPPATEAPLTAAETAAAVPTEDLVGPAPAETGVPATEQPAATQPPAEQPAATEAPAEQPLATEPPAGAAEVPAQEPAGTEQAPAEEAPAAGTSEAIPPAEPTAEPVVEPTGEAPSEGAAPATTEAVPGPTATPTLGAAPGATPQAADCANNTDPVANAGGPYEAMMGKGEAYVTFDGSGSSDPDGMIVTYEWDFGDGNADNGQSITYGYASTGTFVAALTVTDNCGAIAQATADVTITGSTPPAATPAPTTTPGLPPTGQGHAPHQGMGGNPGFCYRVHYGDTLSGIAWYFGVYWPDLAMVNGVEPEYYVIEGQGLFIPTGPIEPGPNLYEVDSGDTWYSIAYQCGLPAPSLADANGMDLDQALSPGQMVVIPPWRWD